MEQWEYRTYMLEAQAENDRSMYASFVRGDPRQLPAFSPITLIPQLNYLGEQGWELVACHPYAFGPSNHDVLAFGGVGVGGRIWTHNYLCVFKRRKE